MYLTLLSYAFFSGCASLQAQRSGIDFQEGPFQRIYAERTDSELLGVGSKEIKLLDQTTTDEGIAFRFQSRPMCLKRDFYNDILRSEKYGKTFLGNTFAQGQTLGWLIDLGIIGGTYLALTQFRQEDTQLWPELTTLSVAAVGISINSLSMYNALENRYQESTSEKESLVSCGNWGVDSEIDLTGRDDLSSFAAQRSEQKLILPRSELTKMWLNQKTADLTMTWKAKSKDFSNSEALEQTLKITPQPEWLCSIIASEELNNYLQSQRPKDSFPLTNELSCTEEMRSSICQNGIVLAQRSQYDLQSGSFKHPNGRLKLDDVEQYIRECGSDKEWSNTFENGVSTLIEEGGGLVEIGELIDTHDSFISTEYSGKMKKDLLRYSFRGIMEEYDREGQLYLSSTLIRYLDDPGIPGRTRSRYRNKIRKQLEDGYQSCSDIWPSPTAPCLESFIKLITSSNEMSQFYLQEQFNTCTEEDMQLNKLCIIPLMQHTEIFGTRWKDGIERDWKKSVYRNARTMLKSKGMPAKRINQSLVYLTSWEPYLGTDWKDRFVLLNIRPLVDDMLSVQLEDQSPSSYEISAKIVSNYRAVLGDKWSRRQRDRIDKEQNRWLNQSDRAASRQKKALRRSRCSVWSYPSIAACSSRYMGFEECTPKPTITKRVYPDCSPMKKSKCICP
ncbi:MAG: hypothetical protein VX278_00085 [Myxococcota bacterium]|nr:hypothetical protein [Myxococcota bacterium]